MPGRGNAGGPNPRPPTRLPLNQALLIAIQLASALNAAHRRGIVHRDVKPTESPVECSDYFGCPPTQSRRAQSHPHELRLLKMLVDGHNYKAAASELGVSVTTVASTLRNIYGKLRVHSKSEVVAKALRNRLV